MEVHKARAFLAVAEELHFGRAAARLHMAQPPLSRLIRALEQELGADLFVRSPRKVELTPVGEALVEPARELVMQSERMKDLVRRVQAGESGRVSLGFSGSSVNSIVGTLVRKVRHERPELGLDLRGSQLSYRGLERLREGQLDAVIGRWDYLPRDVNSVVIAEEELLVALPDNHRLAAAASITAKDLADEPWVVLPSGSGATLANRLHLLGAEGRFVPRIVETVADSATQFLLVDAGIGLALTFSGVRENIPAHAVVFRPLKPSLGRVQIRLAWKADSENPLLGPLIEIADSLDVAASDTF
jgi:DNA-binding transcriptional LysR family regulator